MAADRDRLRRMRAMAVLLAAAPLVACTAPTPPREPTAPAEATAPAEPAAPPPTAPASSQPAPPPATTPPPTAEPPAPVPVESAKKPVRPQAQPPRPAEIPPRSPPPGDKAAPAIAVTILSKGRGVPEPTREVYRRIRTLFEEQQAKGVVTDLTTRRLGLEGETRLCAQFQDAAQAEAALEEIRQLAADVELLNVVQEPCQDIKGDLP